MSLLLLLFVIIVPVTAQAQKGLQAYDRGDLDEVRRLLNSRTLEAAEEAFLRAALTVAADSAMKRYHQIVLKYPDNPVSQRARERISQYYYTLGNYSKANEFAATPNAPTISSPPPETTPTLPPTTKSEIDSVTETPQVNTDSGIAPSRNSIIRLQVGAFSKRENAQALKLKIEKAGYQVLLIDAQETPYKLYTVQIIGFPTKEAAQKAMEELNKNLGIKAIVVTANP